MEIVTLQIVPFEVAKEVNGRKIMFMFRNAKLSVAESHVFILYTL